MNDLIPTSVLEAARRGVARGVLQWMLKVEHRTPDPAERWRVLRRVLGMMVRGGPHISPRAWFGCAGGRGGGC